MEKKKKSGPLGAVKKIKTGSGGHNPDDLEEIIEHCYSQLLRTARTLLQSPADAEDAVQSALFKAVVKYPRFKGNAHYCTYLTRIVINESLTVLQKKSLHQRCLQSPLPRPEIRRPEEVLESKIIRKRVLEILKKMPAAMGQTLYWRFIKNYSYMEISRQLNCSAGTVKSRLRRGKKLLLKSLTELYPEICENKFPLL